MTCRRSHNNCGNPTGGRCRNNQQHTELNMPTCMHWMTLQMQPLSKVNHWQAACSSREVVATLQTLAIQVSPMPLHVSTASASLLPQWLKNFTHCRKSMQNEAFLEPCYCFVPSWTCNGVNNNVNYYDAVLAKRRQVHAAQINSLQTGCVSGQCTCLRAA